MTPGRGVGNGGMDLAFNAKRVIAPEHITKGGKSKFCSFHRPQCVDLIVTDVAVIEVGIGIAGICSRLDGGRDSIHHLSWLMT